MKSKSFHPRTPATEYALAPLGAAECPPGSVAVEREICDAATKSIAATVGVLPEELAEQVLQEQTADFSGDCEQAAGWERVPLGCSAQTGGSWVSYFREGAVPQDWSTNAECATARSGYQVVCRLPSTSVYTV